jgi:uncharacterized membrane protein YjjP (DUF1212 family)
MLRDDKKTALAIERALDVSLIVMQNGGSTRMADLTFRRILRGYGEEGPSISWRLDAVTVCGAADGRSFAVVRPVGSIGINLVRASEAAVLAERVARGEVNVNDLGEETARIRALPPPYRRWTLIAAAAFGAACFSRIPGGDWGSAGVAFVAAGTGQFCRTPLQAKLSVANVIFVCAIISACIAALGLRLGLSSVAPATAVASLIYMVPGLPLINGFVDVMSHEYLLVGFERIANASFRFLILAIALAFADAIML